MTSPWALRFGLTIGFATLAFATPILLYAIKDERSGWPVTLAEALGWVWLFVFFPQWVSLLVVSCLPSAGVWGNLFISWLGCVPASWIYALAAERILSRRAAS